MYGKLPRVVAFCTDGCDDMMFYQDMPIKLIGQSSITVECRIRDSFDKIIATACCDFVGNFGLDRFVNSYVYICAKRLWQSKGTAFNREGWHTDGFGTEDITYLWSNHSPTVFNSTCLNLSDDHAISMQEMNEQVQDVNNVTYPDGALVQMDQYVVHKVGEQKEGVRSFLKIVFSKDKFDLLGNAHNYLLE